MQLEKIPKTNYNSLLPKIKCFSLGDGRGQKYLIFQMGTARDIRARIRQNKRQRSCRMHSKWGISVRKTAKKVRQGMTSLDEKGI